MAATMQERFDQDLIDSMKWLSNAYKTLKKEMADTPSFCCKLTTFNDDVLCELHKIMPGFRNVGAYLCVKLSVYEAGEYYDGYLYLLCAQNRYNFYKVPDHESLTLGSYGLALVNRSKPTDLEYYVFKDIDSVIKQYRSYCGR